MSIYSFEGRKEKTGELVRGLREASSHAALGRDLLSEGVLLTRYVQKVQKLQKATFFSAIFNRVPIIERALFARYFGLMLRAGLDVKRSITSLGQQTRSKPMKAALEEIYNDVERGKTLAESMDMFPHIFSPLFVSFIRVGETTGRLQESLVVLSEQLQKEYELSRAIRGALLYPAVIVVSLIAVAVAMMYFVVPKLAEVFEGFDVELPFLTRMLMNASEIFQVYWYVFFIGAFVLAGVVWWLLRLQSIKAAVMQWLLFVPVVGPIMQKINLARFSRNLSSLLKSGVSFIKALNILSTNTPHPSYAKVFAAAREHVKQGKELSAFLEDFKRLFPPIVVNVIKTGEETGALDKVLDETALFYEGEVDQTMKNLTSIVEPILMIVVGLAVGALAISIISPIYNLVNVI
jgi:type II secretory pathway component PulF